MNETIAFIRNGIEVIKQTEVMQLTVQAKDVLGLCPFCENGQVIKNKAGWGCNQWKNNGCKFFVSDSIMGKRISEAQVKNLIAKGRTNLIKGFKSKAGKVFNAYLVVDKADGARSKGF